MLFAVDSPADSRHVNDDRRAWLAGHTVSWCGNRFRILATLARGGMAEIFLAVAEDAAEGAPPYVVKRLLRDRGAYDATVKAMFEHEARVASHLDHPNVASHFGTGDDDGETFLVMEYLEGQTLAALSAMAEKARRPLSVEASCDVVARVLRGLAYVHAATSDRGETLGIVHRDVCPRNIVVGYDGFVKLIDFGIATSLYAPERLGQGVVKGKPNYMSPEQATGRPSDHRSDIFSAGVVLFELLTGERFSGRSAPPERRTRLPFARVPRVREVRPDVPPELDAVVARALSLDPDARFQSAGDMAAALTAFLATRPDADGRPELALTMQALFGKERERMRRAVAKLTEDALEAAAERRGLRTERTSGVAPRRTFSQPDGVLEPLYPAPADSHARDVDAAVGDDPLIPCDVDLDAFFGVGESLPSYPGARRVGSRF